MPRMPRRPRASAPAPELLEDAADATEEFEPQQSPAPRSPRGRRAGTSSSKRSGFLGKRLKSAGMELVRAASAGVSRQLVGAPHPMTEEEATSIVAPIGRLAGRHLKVSGQVPPDVEDIAEIALTVLLWVAGIVKSSLELRTEALRAQNLAQMRQAMAAMGGMPGGTRFGAAPGLDDESDGAPDIIYAPGPVEVAPESASPGTGATGMQLGADMVAAPPEAYLDVLQRMPGDRGLAALGA